MATKSQDPLFPTPPAMEAAAKKARAAERARRGLPDLYKAANRAAANSKRGGNAPDLVSQAEDALSKLLDAILVGIEPKGNYDDTLPDEFVWVLMAFLRTSDYDRSLESFLMNVIASDHVNPGYVFRAEWPCHMPDYDKTPHILVMRFAD